MDKHEYSLLLKIIILFAIFLAILIFANLFLIPSFSSLLLILSTIILGTLIFTIFKQNIQKINKLEKTVCDLQKENHSINKELNKAIFEILALFEFTNILGGNNIDYQKMLDTMIDTIKRIIDYDGCCLFLFDKQTKILSVSVCRGFPRSMNRKKIPVDQFFFKDVAESGEAVIIEDILNERTRLTSIMPPELFGEHRSFIAIPLLVQNRAIGVLTIAKNTTAGFSHEDLRLLFIIGNEAALAIQNKHLYEQVYYSSITDGLTGLYNHKYFREQIRQNLLAAKEKQQRLSLALMDIDYFKSINDTFGHLEGDQVLKQVSEILKSSVPAEYLIARYGGEEFAILMPEIDSELAIRYSETIRQNIEAYPFQTEDGIKFRVTVSLGIASYPDHISNKERMVEELIDLADENLYRAKREGRNRIYSFK